MRLSRHSTCPGMEHSVGEVATVIVGVRPSTAMPSFGERSRPLRWHLAMSTIDHHLRCPSGGLPTWRLRRSNVVMVEPNVVAMSVGRTRNIADGELSG